MLKQVNTRGSLDIATKRTARLFLLICLMEISFLFSFSVVGLHCAVYCYRCLQRIQQINGPKVFTPNY